MSNYRHGDVGLFAVAALPEGAILERTERIVLAEGELTGHAHRIVAGTASLWNAGEQRYVTVGAGGALLDHEEHGPLPLDEGTYECRIQRVFDYLSEAGWRRVQD